jgi:type IV secretory pathway TrbD component
MIYQRILRWLMVGTGLLIVLLGFVTFWLPIPIGLPLLLVGTALMLRFSSSARRLLVALMRRHPRLRELRQRARGRTGVGIGRSLARSSGTVD